MKETNSIQPEQTNAEDKVITADFENKTIKSPQDLAKRDFSEYFKELRKEITAKVAFGTSYAKTIPNNVTIPTDT
jgi:hypothetical protein